MANPIHRTNIVTKDKRSQRKVADSTTELAKTSIQDCPARPSAAWQTRSIGERAFMSKQEEK